MAVDGTIEGDSPAGWDPLYHLRTEAPANTARFGRQGVGRSRRSIDDLDATATLLDRG
jgi:hypothetical protein